MKERDMTNQKAKSLEPVIPTRFDEQEISTGSIAIVAAIMTLATIAGIIAAL